MLTVILHIVPLQSRLLANGILCLLFHICCRYEPHFPASSALACGHLLMCSFMLWDFGMLRVVTVYLSPLTSTWSLVFPFPYHGVAGTAVLCDIFTSSDYGCSTG